jgi:hypothetical protein
MTTRPASGDERSVVRRRYYRIRHDGGGDVLDSGRRGD